MKAKLRKGIILAGGNGTRLYPTTIAISKQLMPVYDKPMIYYPMSVLMLAGIREVLIICKSDDKKSFSRLFGDGSELGMSIQYEIQDHPGGIAEAVLIAESYLDGAPSALILGDNLFYGAQLTEKLKDASDKSDGCNIFLTEVGNPENFGVVEVDQDGKVLSIEEKPEKPKSNLIAPGMYFFDKYASRYAKTILPSSRGELEIADLLNIYLRDKKLRAQNLGRGFTWLDTGTPKSLLEAGNFVKSIQNSQRVVISCLEEISFNNGWINLQQMQKQSKKYKKTGYGDYLERIARGYNGG